MGQGIARKDGVDTVYSPHGTGYKCLSPTIQKTDKGSSDVFVNGTGVVGAGDAMITHPAPGCTPHAPGLSTYSSSVFVNGKGVGRVGDTYGEHTITSGSSNVFGGD
jgi:uncharacterized Zn-binding protein involved in type VI secretion